MCSVAEIAAVEETLAKQCSLWMAQSPSTLQTFPQVVSACPNSNRTEVQMIFRYGAVIELVTSVNSTKERALARTFALNKAPISMNAPIEGCLSEVLEYALSGLWPLSYSRS